jgi:hypothetical protein
VGSFVAESGQFSGGLLPSAVLVEFSENGGVSFEFSVELGLCRGFSFLIAWTPGLLTGGFDDGWFR